jgi:hypothetical protein
LGSIVSPVYCFLTIYKKSFTGSSIKNMAALLWIAAGFHLHAAGRVGEQGHPGGQGALCAVSAETQGNHWIHLLQIIRSRLNVAPEYATYPPCDVPIL